MKRKICVVTGSRAEYGLLYWTMKAIDEDRDLALKLIVTGMHLVPKFGMTVREIEKDGFEISERVKMLLDSDRPQSISVSMGIGMIGFAKAYERIRPDIILVLGDRFEIMSAVTAAIPFKVPIAHIHGGEATEGVIDEAIRHAITKMSHIHFTSTEEHRRRVIQMGEFFKNAHCFGAPGLENVFRLKLLKKKELFRELGLPKDAKLGVVTYHPVTLENDTAGPHILELLNATKAFDKIYWIFTMPNADTGSRVIIKRVEAFIRRHSKNGKIYASLGQLKYLSLLKNARVMVGNSSSGLIEAPSFELPVVNIGDRQLGRVRAKNVIDVPTCERGRIARAVKLALSAEFRKSLQGLKNPYGEGNVSGRIVEVLKTVRLGEGLIKKKFRDITK